MSVSDLRDWQESAIHEWETNAYRGIFEVATGGGKTRFALAARDHLLTQVPGLRTVVVVPTRALLDQWYVDISEHVGGAESQIKVLSSADLLPSAQFNLAVINTARHFPKLVDYDNGCLLIVDECHRAGSYENSKSLRLPNIASIGLSATPSRQFDDGLTTHLVPGLGPILLRYTLAQAIADGVLSDLRLVYVRIPLLAFEEEQYKGLTRRIARAFQSDDSEAVEVLLRARSRLSNEAFFRLPVTRSLLEHRRGRRAILFLESIAEADKLHEEVLSDGHTATIYHSGLSIGLRRSNLRLFRRGVFDVLVACRALDEGLNVPEADLAIIVAATSSIRQRTQRVGRVLRTMDHKSFGEVVTLYATEVEEHRLRAESESLGLAAQTTWLTANVE